MTPETEAPPPATDGEHGWDDEPLPGDQPITPVNSLPDDYIPPMPKLRYPPGSPERQRKLEELAAKATATWESIDGVGKDWGTDEEFEAFLEYLRRSRKDGP